MERSKFWSYRRWLAGMVMACPQVVVAGESPQQDADGWGTWSARLQTITMHRDYRDLGRSSGSNTSTGLQLGYRSPMVGPFTLGLLYDLVGSDAESGNSGLNCNDDIHLLTEAWLQGQLAPGCSAKLGRQVVNGEVFRADPFRHKSRALEALTVEADSRNGLRLMAGHAIRLSNWVQHGDSADFNRFEDVLGGDDSSHGVTWVELGSPAEGTWQWAVFDAHAEQSLNLLGARLRGQQSRDRAVLGFIRHEEDLSGDAGGADAFGLALEQVIGGVTLECGSFSVRGDKLRFQETTTGLNHALGSLMLLCDEPFAGGADTGYLKALYPCGPTTLYGLYAYTHHDELRYDGHELNLVAKQQVTPEFSVTVKLGLGLREPQSGGSQMLTDSRLFVTYQF